MRLVVEVSDSDYEQIFAHCKATETAVADVLRVAVHEYVGYGIGAYEVPDSAVGVLEECNQAVDVVMEGRVISISTARA